MALQVPRLLTNENKTAPGFIFNLFFSTAVCTTVFTLMLFWTLFFSRNSSDEHVLINWAMFILWCIMGLLLAWLSTIPVRRGIKLWKGALASVAITLVAMVTSFVTTVVILAVMQLLGIPTGLFLPQ